MPARKHTLPRMVEVLHVKVYRAGIGGMGFRATLNNEPADPDDGGEFDDTYHETPRQAVEALMLDLEKRWAMQAWDDYCLIEKAGRNPKRRRV